VDEVLHRAAAALRLVLEDDPAQERAALAAHSAAQEEVERSDDLDLGLWTALLRGAIVREDPVSVAHALRGMIRSVRRPLVGNTVWSTYSIGSAAHRADADAAPYDAGSPEPRRVA
jgi:hypothetical protein